MATEVLTIPEEHLQEVVHVIRKGLSISGIEVSDLVKEKLTLWCEAEEDYLLELHQIK